MGHHVRNSLVTVQTFLDLLPEKLLEEKVDMGQLRGSDFWKEFYEQTRSPNTAHYRAIDGSRHCDGKSDSPVLGEAQLDETVARSLEKLKSNLLQKSITVFNQIPPESSGLGGGGRKVPISFRPATKGRDHEVACRKSDFHERTS